MCRTCTGNEFRICNKLLNTNNDRDNEIQASGRKWKIDGRHHHENRIAEIENWRPTRPHENPENWKRKVREGTWKLDGERHIEKWQHPTIETAYCWKIEKRRNGARRMVPLYEELVVANGQVVDTGGYQKQSQWWWSGILRTEDTGTLQEERDCPGIENLILLPRDCSENWSRRLENETKSHENLRQASENWEILTIETAISMKTEKWRKEEMATKKRIENWMNEELENRHRHQLERKLNENWGKKENWTSPSSHRSTLTKNLKVPTSQYSSFTIYLMNSTCRTFCSRLKDSAMNSEMLNEQTDGHCKQQQKKKNSNCNGIKIKWGETEMRDSTNERVRMSCSRNVHGRTANGQVRKTVRDPANSMESKEQWHEVKRSEIKWKQSRQNEFRVKRTDRNEETDKRVTDRRKLENRQNQETPTSDEQASDELKNNAKHYYKYIQRTINN